MSKKFPDETSAANVLEIRPFKKPHKVGEDDVLPSPAKPMAVARVFVARPRPRRAS